MGRRNRSCTAIDLIEEFTNLHWGAYLPGFLSIVWLLNSNTSRYSKLHQRGGMMNKESDISKNRNQSDQEDMTSREKKPVSSASLLVLGASFIVLVVLTITLVQKFTAIGENGLLTFLSGMLALAVFFWLSTLLALRFHTEKAKLSPHEEVHEDTLVKHGIP